MEEVECLLSGLLPMPVELVADDEDDLPVGWTRITVERRIHNPEWERIQTAKDQMAEAMYVQAVMQIQGTAQQMQAAGQQPPPMPPEAEIRALGDIQAAATFAALENRTPRYLMESDAVFLAPPERDPQLPEAIAELLGAIGVEEYDVEEDSADELPPEADAEVPVEPAPAEPAEPAPAEPAPETEGDQG